MAEIRPQPQSPALGALARMLGAARDAAGRVRIDSQLLGQTSLADLLSLPGAAGLAEDVSYFGPAAMLRPGSGRTLQTFKLDPRVLDAADVALNVSPLGVLAARGAARAARPVARAAGESVNRAMLTGEGPLAAALAPVAPLSVVKPKGGNWLAGSVEGAVKGLKSGRPTHRDEALMLGGRWANDADLPEVQQMMAQEGALNKWLDKKLAGYLRNEMATPEDPVRALAERGITHHPELRQFEENPALLDSPSLFTEDVRRRAGYPEAGLGRSPLARGWEHHSDEVLWSDPAGEVLEKYAPTPMWQSTLPPDMAWLTKVPPETPVYKPAASGQIIMPQLGFDHLVDELRNALDPASGLPRELRLQPKDLDKITVPQAVERVAQINAWRAEQKTAADLARANTAASVEYRAYPTVPGTDRPNEKGLRWVELRQPKVEPFTAETLPERFKIEGGTLPSGKGVYEVRDTQAPVIQNTGGVGSTPEEALANFNKWYQRERADTAQLEAALKYEGDTMGHCVGRYCPDVASGRSRIFSLRDARGEPHVTVEVSPRTSYGTEHLRAQRPQAEREAAERGLDPESSAYSDFIGGRVEELARENLPLDIIQIKGKANLAPKEEYLPFVQDFVRSGQWGRVGDIGNTGLRKVGGEFLTKAETAARIEPALRFLREHPALEPFRSAAEAEYAFQGRIPSPEYTAIQRAARRPITENRDYVWRELEGVLSDPSSYEPESLGHVLEAVEKLRARYPEPEGFARGGAVNAQTGPAQYDPADIARRAATLMEELDARLA